MRYLKSNGKTVACMKPVSAGCELTPDGLRNDDALQLIQEASVEQPYDLVNPYAFEAPIAPHIAASKSGTDIDVQTIKDSYTKISKAADVVIVEGAGGWLVPVNHKQTMADIAETLKLPVILVVGLRLGCLNHALLTVESIKNSAAPLMGWIANHVDDNMLNQVDNIETLKNMIAAPLLGTVNHCKNTENCIFEANVEFGLR